MARLPDRVLWIERLMASGTPAAISLAPSFPLAFAKDRWPLVASAVASLGFEIVEPTTVVLPDIVQMRAKAAQDSEVRAEVHAQISSCCPNVVKLAEGSCPEAVRFLSAAPSPATHHCRELRKRLGPASLVVFATPCPDKADEATRPENSGAADVVITFIELATWLEQREAWKKADTRDFRRQAPYWTYASLLVLHIAGMDECRELLQRANSLPPGFYEALACRHGCMGGPGLPNLYDIGVRSAVIEEYVSWVRDQQQAVERGA